MTRAILIGALAAALLPPAAKAQATQFIIAEIKAQTPSCRDTPSAPVKGRVSGIISGFPSRGASFVGCFDTMAECERWRGRTSGRISGRLIQNRCEPR